MYSTEKQNEFERYDSEFRIILQMINSIYPSALVLNVVEMSRLLQCSNEHIRRLIRSHKLQSINKRRHLVKKTDFARYLKENNNGN